MDNLIEVAKTNELAEETMKEVFVEGHEILLARVSGRYYAAENRCPHMGGRLSHGQLEGTVVTCPSHGSRFDLTTGQVVRWLKGSGLMTSIGKFLKPPRPLRTYRVEIEGDRIQLEIPSET